LEGDDPSTSSRKGWPPLPATNKYHKLIIQEVSA
jgi:hypothetical protein